MEDQAPNPEPRAPSLKPQDVRWIERGELVTDDLKILLVGELAYNAERVLALEERGHKLYGLWTPEPYWWNTVGPLPFGHVEDIPRAGRNVGGLRGDALIGPRRPVGVLPNLFPQSAAVERDAEREFHFRFRQERGGRHANALDVARRRGAGEVAGPLDAWLDSNRLRHAGRHPRHHRRQPGAVLAQRGSAEARKS